MTTEATKAIRKESTRTTTTPQGPIMHGPARTRREIQWGLRYAPSPAERRRMARKAA